MAILNTGRTKVRDLISNDITQGKLGTGTTVFNEAQTDLISAVSGTLDNVSISNINKGVKVSYNLLPGAGNGYNYTEYITISSDTSTAYSRIVFSEIPKTDEVDLLIDSYFFIEINEE